jgi:hypothetical protein
MNVKLNEDKKQYEISSAGRVFAVLPMTEAKTKKEALQKFGEILTNFLRNWQPARLDS